MDKEDKIVENLIGKSREIGRTRKTVYMHLYGCSGSGKTYTAILMATKLAGDNSKVFIIDYENRASIYDDIFPNAKVFSATDIEDMQNIKKLNILLRLVFKAKEHGYKAVVIDGLTTVWDDICYNVDKSGKSSAFGANWKEDKRMISAFSESLQRIGIHVITTTLANEIVGYDKDKKQIPSGKYKPAFEVKHFSKFLDAQYFLTDNGTIKSIDKNPHPICKMLFKENEQITEDKIIQFKNFLDKGCKEGNTHEQSGISGYLKGTLDEACTVNDTFNAMKDLSKEERVEYYGKLPENIKQMIKNPANGFKDRLAEYDNFVKEYDITLEEDEPEQKTVAEATAIVVNPIPANKLPNSINIEHRSCEPLNQNQTNTLV